MKKVYEAPIIEIEKYELSGSIAANCNIVVSNGPGIEGYLLCEDYKPEDGFGGYALQRAVEASNVNFYEDTCDCYYSANGQYWTS